jgi:hypothetical protein
VAAPTVSTENFMGTGRYLLAGFPAFAYIGERLSKRRTLRPAIAWLAVSGGLMLFMGFEFARSTYLS